MSNSDFENKYKTKHKRISFWKSWIRMTGCVYAIMALIAVGPTLDALLALPISFLIAETLGIYEEMI